MDIQAMKSLDLLPANAKLACAKGELGLHLVLMQSVAKDEELLDVEVEVLDMQFGDAEKTIMLAYPQYQLKLDAINARMNEGSLWCYIERENKVYFDRNGLDAFLKSGKR